MQSPIPTAATPFRPESSFQIVESDSDGSPIIPQSTVRKAPRRLIASDDEEDDYHTTHSRTFFSAISCFDGSGISAHLASPERAGQDSG